jgi:hypothetical protein
LDLRFEIVERRLGEHDHRFDRMDDRFDRVDARLDKMDSKLEQIRRELRSNLLVSITVSAALLGSVIAAIKF